MEQSRCRGSARCRTQVQSVEELMRSHSRSEVQKKPQELSGMREATIKRKSSVHEELLTFHLRRLEEELSKGDAQSEFEHVVTHYRGPNEATPKSLLESPVALAAASVAAAAHGRVAELTKALANEKEKRIELESEATQSGWSSIFKRR